MSAVSILAPPELTARDLATIRRLVYEKSGIALHEGKGALITARLQKRLRARGVRSFREYIRYVQADPSGDELTALIDAITTNHTAFFREPQHFTFLRDVVLPPLVARSPHSVIRAWSAACATGEEAYSIAMVMFDRLGDTAPLRAHLLASDLSTRALAVARAGIYRMQRMADVPPQAFLSYFEKPAGMPRGSVRVAAPLRQVVDIRQINLLDPMLGGQTFDFIFCRNVMIYFDRQVQQRVVEMLEHHLVPGGYLFVSHSESLTSLRHGLTWMAPAVYRRPR